VERKRSLKDTIFEDANVHRRQAGGGLVRKELVEDMDLWSVILPGAAVVPLVVVLGAPTGLLLTALLWLGFRAAELLYATVPESRFDPADGETRILARLSATETIVEQPGFKLAERLDAAATRTETDELGDPLESLRKAS